MKISDKNSNFALFCYGLFLWAIFGGALFNYGLRSGYFSISVAVFVISILLLFILLRWLTLKGIRILTWILLALSILVMFVAEPENVRIVAVTAATIFAGALMGSYGVTYRVDPRYRGPWDKDL